MWKLYSVEWVFIAYYVLGLTSAALLRPPPVQPPPSVQPPVVTLVATWTVGTKEQSPAFIVHDFPNRPRCEEVAKFITEVALPPKVSAKCI